MRGMSVLVDHADGRYVIIIDRGRLGAPMTFAVANELYARRAAEDMRKVLEIDRPVLWLCGEAVRS